jgi:hypothetical protein
MTMRTKNPNNILYACEFGQLSEIAGGVSYEDLAALIDGFGQPAIHHVAARRQLDKIEPRVTASQLAQSRNALTGNTGLHFAAESKALDQIDGGATAQDLAAARNIAGYTALHSAVRCRALGQITGGVTIQQLIDARDNDGNSAIFINVDWVKDVNEKLIFDKLASVRDSIGQTVIHELASSGRLDTISGGVTAEQLAGLRNNDGITALEEALLMCPLSQIQGGLQPVLQNGLLTIPQLNDALQQVLDDEYFHDEDKVREFIELGAKKDIVLGALRNAVSFAETIAERRDPQKQDQEDQGEKAWLEKQLRFLIPFAADCGFEVSDVVPPKIMLQLLGLEEL